MIFFLKISCNHIGRRNQKGVKVRHHVKSVAEENRLLVTDEPVEFENNRPKFNTSGKLEAVYRIYPSFMKKKTQQMSTCEQVTGWTLETLGFDRLCPKIFPGTDVSQTLIYGIQIHRCQSMIGENRQLVTNEPVEFEEYPVEVQDCKKITDHFRGIYRIYPNLIKENRRMSTCNRLDLQALGSQPVMPENLPDHWCQWLKCEEHN